MTIQERTNNYGAAHSTIYTEVSIREAYQQGWKDAVEMACEWLTERLQFGCHPCNGISLVEEFRKVMEE